MSIFSMMQAPGGWFIIIHGPKYFKRRDCHAPDNIVTVEYYNPRKK